MKNLLILVLLCQFTFAGDPPRLGWNQVTSETFTLKPTGKHYFALAKGRWKLEFQADTSVYTGVLTPKQYAEAMRLKYLPLTAFRGFACVKLSVMDAQTECNVSIPRAFLAIRDKRGPISGAFGVTEGAAGATGLVTAPHAATVDVAAMAASDKKLKENMVKVTIYRWECIEHCPVGTK
jgi:hypothetical protein